MLLPCIGNISYWREFVLGREIFLLTNHTFQKQSELSQYEIVTANGRLKLSVPTQKSSRKGLYKDVLLDYTTNWQIEHWRSIENAYLKSPFFLHYGYKIEATYKENYESLMDFNLAIFSTLCTCLKINKLWKVDSKTPISFQKTTDKEITMYPQVFDTKMEFEKNLCVLDLIFNLGPEAKDYLASL